FRKKSTGRTIPTLLARPTNPSALVALKSIDPTERRKSEIVLRVSTPRNMLRNLPASSHARTGDSHSVLWAISILMRFSPNSEEHWWLQTVVSDLLFPLASPQTRL